jgi:hypothetical protein
LIFDLLKVDLHHRAILAKTSSSWQTRKVRAMPLVCMARRKKQRQEETVIDLGATPAGLIDVVGAGRCCAMDRGKAYKTV